MEKIGKLFNVLFCAAFGWVVAVVLFCMLKSFCIAVIATAMAIAAIVLLAKNSDNLPKINYNTVFYAVLAVSFIIMTALSFALEVDYSWDWGRLIISASNYVMYGGYIDDVEYFATYPNNQFWFTVLIGLFKFVKFILPQAQPEHFKFISIFVSVVMVQASILLTYETAKLFWGEKRAFFTGLAAVLFLPLYLYAMFAYTDTSGMLVLMLILYFYEKAKRTEKIKRIAYCAAVGLFAALAYQIKVTVFIVFIAAIIEAAMLIFKNKQSRGRLKEYAVCALSCVLAFAIAYGATEGVVKSTVPISKSVADRYEFPLTHWVMMALNKDGGYLEKDVKFTKKFKTKNAKELADKKRIKKRLAKMGAAGTVKHVMYKKVARTWGESLLFGDEYAGRYPLHENGVLQKFLTRNGNLRSVTLLYAWPYYFILLLLVFASGIVSIKKKLKDQKAFVCRLAMFGLFVFLLVWECNARYLVAFIPIIILAASSGAFGLADNAKAIDDFMKNTLRRKKRGALR